MIAVDGSPLVFGPRGVARALQALIDGWAVLPREDDLRVLLPGRGGSARAFRATLPALVAGADGFLSPWSAFPDLSAAGVPTVALIHELPFVRHGPIEGRVRAFWHRRWLRRGVRGCAALVVPSEATRADVLALHPDAAARVHVVPHGFDPAPWEAAAGRLPPAPSSAREPYAVMVGTGAGRRMAFKKGLDVALGAWRRGLVPAALHLVLVGRPAGRLPPGVEARAALSDEALRDLVAGARLLLYPSRSEGFGYPPLEAFAAGVPVVASDVRAVREVAGPAAWFVPPGDACALGATIGQVLADDEARAARVALGRERARAFAPARTAAAWRDVFAHVRHEA